MQQRRKASSRQGTPPFATARQASRSSPPGHPARPQVCRFIVSASATPAPRSSPSQHPLVPTWRRQRQKDKNPDKEVKVHIQLYPRPARARGSVVYLQQQCRTFPLRTSAQDYCWAFSLLICQLYLRSMKARHPSVPSKPAFCWNPYHSLTCFHG